MKPKSLQPQIYSRDPAVLQLDPNKSYLWCSCGHSKTQPFCDGSHQGSDFLPLRFTPKDGYTVWLCNCKYSKHPPYCDGRHNKLAKILNAVAIAGQAPS